MESKQPFRKLARQGYQTFRRRRVIESVVLGASIIIPLILLALVAGMLLRYRPASGWVVPALALLAIGVGVTMAIRYGMRHRFTYPEFLRHLERRLDLQRNELINADELEAELPTFADPLSRGLATQAVDEGRSRLASVSFPALSKARHLRIPMLRVLSAAGAMLLLAFVAPDGFRASLERLFTPGSFELPPAFQISVLPGNVTIPRGAIVRVQALVPEDSEDAQLVWRPKGGGWKSVEMRPAGTADEEGAIRQIYQFTLAGLSEDTEYAVAAGRTRSEGYQIGVTEPLRAQNFKKTITPPTYTGLSVTEEVALDGNFAAVVGSRATLTVHSSRPDALGRLIFEEGDPVPLQSHGDGILVADLVIQESSRYRVELTDPSLPGVDYNSSIYRIDASPDRLPTLYQLAPERSIPLPPEMQVELDVDCLDDFGLTRLDLVYRRNDKPAQRVNLATWQGDREARVVYPWDLEGIAIAPGDVVQYHLELTDNDAVAGPKTVNGPECEVRFPKLEEMYANVHEDREEQEADVQNMVESQKQLAEELDKALHDVKANKDLSWEKQEGLKDLAARQEQLTKKLEDLAQSLDRSLERMEQAELFSPEMMEKIQQISELVKQIQDPEFQKQIDELRKALEKLDKKGVERTLEQMQMSQNDLEQSLDRTLELLQKMQTEEHLDQVVKETQRLLEQQERLNQELGRAQEQDPKESQTPKNDPSSSEPNEAPEPQSAENQEQTEEPTSEKQSESQDQTEKQDAQENQEQSGQEEASLDPEEAAELQKRQEELKKELEKLQEELAKLAEEAEENWEQLAQEMKENKPQSQAESAKQKMEAAAGQMGQKQNKKQSLQFGRQAESELQELSQQMQQMQQNLAQKDQEEIIRQLFAISGKLVNLSQNQEQLLKEAPSRSAREIAEFQSSIAEGGKQTLDDLYALGKKSQFLSPDLAKSMGQAVQSLDGTTRSFEQGNRQAAMAQGHTSTNTMNQTVIELLETNQQMCSQAQSSSCNNPMGKMRGLSAQQEQLNGESQGMLGQSPRLRESQSEQERLEDLAARQEMIRRGLDEVGGALEGRKDILGNLDDLGQEMEELTEEMRERGTVDERILERQQKILSRLLTAQKSIRREDFDDERIARTGVNPEDREAPPPLTEELSGDDLLRRGILRGSQDPVPDEFRSLVDDYFQSLSEPR